MTAAPLTKRKERDLRNAILDLLRVHGIAAWPTGGGAFRVGDRFVRMGTKGMSDIVGLMPTLWLDKGGARVGRFLAIEVKSPRGKIRPEQVAFLQTVTRAGGIGFVARSVEEVKEKLNL